MSDNRKLKTALRYWYEGLEYFDAVKAMAFAELLHKGMRKDGVTPEFHHQISIAGYLKTLHNNLLEPQAVYAAAWLHDAQEDYPSAYHANKHSWQLEDPNIIIAIDLLDKTNKETTAYYTEIAHNHIASIVKGADRIHNIQTMVGVFTQEKQASYIAEVKGQVLPMLKSARVMFPEQANAYHNIVHVLNTQLELLSFLTPEPGEGLFLGLVDTE